MNSSEEKLCLKWNDFQENVISAFGALRDEKEFADVTLVCEDGQQMEAHKIVLASCSPLFQTLLRANKHPHPLIYMRGLKSETLLALVDFLYCGEANVYQNNLDSFLAVAEELKLKGLSGNKQTMEPQPETQSELYQVPKTKPRAKNYSQHSTKIDNTEDLKPSENSLVPMETLGRTNTRNYELDETVNSMMKKIGQGQYSCNVCGKTNSQKWNMRNHIEAKHIEGVSHPCAQCGKQFRSRNSHAVHLSTFHKLN